jgi:hypothetical protein
MKCKMSFGGLKCFNKYRTQKKSSEGENCNCFLESYPLEAFIDTMLAI